MFFPLSFLVVLRIDECFAKGLYFPYVGILRLYVSQQERNFPMSTLVTKRHLTFDVPLVWRIVPGEHGFALAICDQLDMTLQIDDGPAEQQHKQLDEAFRLLYVDLEESGDLEQFFTHHGVKITIQDSILKTDPSVEVSLASIEVSPHHSTVLT